MLHLRLLRLADSKLNNLGKALLKRIAQHRRSARPAADSSSLGARSDKAQAKLKAQSGGASNLKTRAAALKVKCPK